MPQPSAPRGRPPADFARVPRTPREPLAALASFFGLPIVLLGVGLGFRPDAAARGDQATAPAPVPPPAARAAAVVGTAARAPAARPATQPPARAR